MARKESFSILIIDDDAADREMLTSLLTAQDEWNISCVSCTDLDRCRGLIAQRSVDMAIISYRFDARNGFAFLTSLRTADSELPIVILTSRGDEHITAEIIRGGATDYIAKDDLSALRARRLMEQMLAHLTRRKEKKRAETILRLNEQNYRTLVDNIPDIVFVHRDGTIVFINQAVETMLGYTEQEVVGKPVFAFIPSEGDRRIVADNMRRRTNGEQVPDYEISVQDKKGALHTVVVRASPTVFNDQPAFQVVLIDITKRKKGEEELLRTRKLESLGILAGGIAHDFNNILTGIIAGIGAVKMKVPAGSEAADLLNEIEKAAFKAGELTRELLTFSRGGEPELKVCCLKPIIKETLRLSSYAENISCTVEVPDNVLCVVADRSQISQVLSNLFLNAVQAMPDGGTVTIRASNVYAGPLQANHPAGMQKVDDAIPLSDGLYVKTDVIDNGMGIPEANLDKIFDPFFSTRTKGTGLGLATVFSILQKHKGHITVHSELGKGTAFSFYLPATLEPCPAEADVQKRPLASRGKILVMDDDETILFTLEKLLAAIGYEVACVHDGEEALRAWREMRAAGTPFAAVLMDLTIPGGLGGRETMERLHAEDPSAKAIAISGYHNDPIMINYRRYGFSAALKKPFRPDELKELLKSMLGEKKSP